MTDLTKLSDDELRALYLQSGGERSVWDKLTGATGPRYQTWPEQLIRGIASLPQRTIEAVSSEPPGSRELSDALVPVAVEAALTTMPVNPAMRAGDRAISGVSRALKAEKPVAPTTEELARVGGADINAAKKRPLDIAASALADFSRGAQQKLMDDGIHPVDAEKTFAKLKELEKPPSGSLVTPANLQSLRESFGATAQNFNPNFAKDQLASSRVIKGLDEFLPNIAEKDILTGTPAAARETAEQLARGRGNYAAAQRSNDLTGALDRANTGILERAEARAQAAYSGRNIDNTIRSKVVSLLEKPKEVSGFSDAELAALSGVAEGGRGRNTARYIANILGGGGGGAQTLITAFGGGAGAMMGGVPGAIIGTVVPATGGAVAKSIANALAKKDLRAADELVRRRAPLYEERLANPNMTPVSAEMRAALARALLLNQQQ